ncbi:MAG: divergent polysaccharide deacetylase family protein [Candidatus Krumholzibacteria bacterium]|nr:divergent polysaccharide deacetylase family protein [Candidatus Krumholzibacteria bacterium]
MARKKKKKKKTTKHIARVKRIAWSLGIAALVTISLLRYFQTVRGGAFLLDAGFSGRYTVVQEALSEEVIKALHPLAIFADDIKVTMEKPDTSGRSVVVMRGEVPHGGSMMQVNAAIDDAALSIGARVRRCIEKQDGRVIEMELGTRRFITHRCYFRMSKRGKVPYRIEKTGPAVSIVVDDFGFFNNKLVKEFLELDVPVTISVIPGLKHSEKICKMAEGAGKEALCHLPMEPEKGADDVGDIPLVRTAMSGREIERIVVKALKTTPGVIGMNNHMGSRATADRGVMDAIMKVCAREDIIFFDSLTSSKSVVREAAAAAGVGSARNDLFLDNNKKDTRENMKKLLSLATRRGRVIAIMHVRRESLEELKWMIGEARRKGIRIIKLSEMIGGESLADNQGGRS